MDKKVLTASPELKTAYLQAESVFQANQQEIGRLGEKIETLSGSIPGLQTAIEIADLRRGKVLTAHAVDQATAQELATAREQHEKAVRDHRDALELLEAVKKAHKAATGRTAALNEARTQALRRVWREVHSNLVEEIRAKAGHLYAMAEVAALKMGADHSGNPFVGRPMALVRENLKKMDEAVLG